MFQRHYRSIGGHRGTARVFQFDQVGEARTLAGAHGRQAVPVPGRSGVDIRHARGGGGDAQHGFFHFPHRGAHLAPVVGFGGGILRPRCVGVGGATPAVKNRQGQRRADRPGAHADGRAAVEPGAGRRDIAGEGKARIALGLGHADTGAGNGKIAFGSRDIGPLRQHAGRHRINLKAGRARQLWHGRRRQLQQFQQRCFILAGERGHRLGFERTLGLALLEHRGCIGRASARQGGVGGRLQAGTGGNAGQARRFSA